MKTYTGHGLDLIAYPMGGIGAGTVCLKGVGALGGIAVRNRPDYRNNPMVFSALCIRGAENTARVLEAPVPTMDIFATATDAGNGLPGTDYGLPRLTSGTFADRFPFATLKLSDPALPLNVEIVGWSPFVPGDEDVSSLPVAALEYTFTNTSAQTVGAVYYFCAENFMRVNDNAGVYPVPGGFVLDQPADAQNPAVQGAFCATADGASVDTAWLRARGGWSFDVLTMLWKGIREGRCENRRHDPDGAGPSPGGTLAVPLSIAPGQSQTVVLRLCWYVPGSDVRAGTRADACAEAYAPWYSGHYASVEAVHADWQRQYAAWRTRTQQFTDCFYNTTLPDVLIEAVAANLCILKSTTVLRQKDGRLWGWEGCHDRRGSCHGSCTHVWNYAQSICHLFPRLERTLRETEFLQSQSESGHQTFRANLPISPIDTPTFHAASDGQLGGIIKAYRDWRICGDDVWLRGLWPAIEKSIAYCVDTWDPDRTGALIEPHHNTYDIEFWGADGMCTGFYTAALKAYCQMADALGEDCEDYRTLYARSRDYMEQTLFNGAYFDQKVQWEGLRAQLSIDEYPPEVQALLRTEGPRYQYGTGCISDAVLGIWLGEISGLRDIVDDAKVQSTLHRIYRHNFRADLSAHANPQRPGYALGHEGGLLLCSWPDGGKPSLPFVYSDEVWTGIEYQVAAHLLSRGMAKEALDIVTACRARYDGTVRNPYNEYECGHWYARAMASYALLQCYTGVSYTRADRTLRVSRHNADSFKTFLCTADGFGTVEVRQGNVTLRVASGTIEVDRIEWEGR